MLIIIMIGGGNFDSRITTEIVKSDGSTETGTLSLKYMT